VLPLRILRRAAIRYLKRGTMFKLRGGPGSGGVRTTSNRPATGAASRPRIEHSSPRPIVRATGRARDVEATVPPPEVAEKKGKSVGDYDRMMNRFENYSEQSILPDLNVIVRLDCHRLGSHWATFPDSSYPLGEEVEQALVVAAASVMCSGLKIRAGYVHGDEISLLLDPSELANGRKRTRLVSSLSSAAAVGMYAAMGRGALFHARVAELPTHTHVLDYFLWQRKVARRNLIARSLILALTKKGVEKPEIDKLLGGANEGARIEALHREGIDIDGFSPYVKYGAILWWGPSEFPSSVRYEGQSVGICECRDLPSDDDEFLTGVASLLQGFSLATEAEVPLRSMSFPRGVAEVLSEISETDE
jgi:tRNA(His) 5'-end guanylyltransferase